MTRITIIAALALATVATTAHASTPLENAIAVQIIGLHMSECPQATPEKTKLLTAEIVSDIKSGKIDMTREDITKSEALVLARMKQVGKDTWCDMITGAMQRR